MTYEWLKPTRLSNANYCTWSFHSIGTIRIEKYGQIKILELQKSFDI